MKANTTMRDRILASAAYFFFFAAGGALIPYLVLYYQEVGIDKQGIGYLLAATTIANVIGAPLWSSVADAFQIHKYLMPFAAFSVIIPAALLSQADQFIWLLILISIQIFFIAPLVPLTDSAVLEMLGDDRAAYGKLRLWGSIGFGIAGWLGGDLIERYGFDAAFGLYIGSMFMLGLTVMQLPAPQPKPPEPFFRNLRQLLTNNTMVVFLLAVFFIGISNTFIFSYFALFMDELGAGERLFGLTVASASVSELPIFFLSAWLIRKFSARGVIIIALGIFALRSLLISFITDPNWAVAVQLLHGPSFSAFWAASVVFVFEVAPPRLRATAQAMLGMMMFGLGGTIGAPVGAAIMEHFDSVMMYRFGTVIGLISVLLFAYTTIRLNVMQTIQKTA